jgi:gamma-glutamylcyclotransferase
LNRVFYFAYGSNLHPLRLLERVPSSAFICCASLEKYRLVFSKLSKDGSAKCTIEQTGRVNDNVYGAIYSISVAEKAILDRYEGEGYRDLEISARGEADMVDCFTYIAKKSYLVDSVLPYDWYRDLVIAGSKFHSMPEAYIEDLHAVETVADPQPQRHSRNLDLLQRIEQKDRKK